MVLLTPADERRQLYARWCGILQTVSQPELLDNSIALRKNMTGSPKFQQFSNVCGESHTLLAYIYAHVRTHSGALRGASAGEGGEGKGRTRRGGTRKCFVSFFPLPPPSSVGSSVG